jgi:hypothetical protein
MKSIGNQLIRYFSIWGILQFGIHCNSKGTSLVVGFTDSDWANDPDDRKFNEGYDFNFGSELVAWVCKKQ